MKKITDPKKTATLAEKNGIRDFFSTPDLDFYIYEYEKGEQITSPDHPLKEILFITEGTIRIYGIRSNGTISPINQHSAPMIIGDVEFAGQGVTPFFADAATAVTCIALPVRKYEKQLHSDIRFLHILLHSCTEKMRMFAFVETAAETIEERVLLYLKNICPSHELNGIEEAVLQLRCSRRQLQRVLKKLCTDGKIEKTGKGKYRLTDEF